MSQSQPNTADYIEGEQIESLLAAAGPEALRDIFDAFWRTSIQLIDALSTQIDRADWGGVYASAHAIKGSAANVGACRLAQSAARMEAASQSQEADALRAVFALLKDDFEATRASVASIFAAAGI